MDILILENNEKSSLECFWKNRGEARFNKLIYKLNFDLKVIEFGEYGEFAYDYKTKKLTKPDPTKFSNLIEFLREVDIFYFMTTLRVIESYLKMYIISTSFVITI